MNNYQNLLIYLSILILFLIIAKIISAVTKPAIKDTKSKFNNFNDYIISVYKSKFPEVLIDYKLNDNSISIVENKNNIDILNTLRYFNFIYDNAPRDILDLYPIADNLSFSWPPKLGTRYKLTAFPYPKSKNTFAAVYGLISNTVDAYTFPGWSIQRHDPHDFNNSIYNNNYFRSYQYVEVLHACYPPPNAKYPLCDDGGWWLYYAAGSGVFWNTGNALISNNKLSAIYDIYKCSLKNRQDIQKYNEENPNNQKSLPPILGLSIADMAKRFEGKEGGSSIMVDIFKIVTALNKHNKKLKVTGFKSIKPSNDGGKAWTKFITLTFFIFYLLVSIIILFSINFRGKSWKIIIVMSIVLLILIVSIIYYYLFIVFEDFFRSLGWMTLKIALKETNMNLEEFVTECVTGNLKNPICNSLAQVQTFDLDIEGYTYAMGYDSFILTSQPNKTGTWEVEMCDLRRYNPAKKGIAIDGGVCNNLNKINTKLDNSTDEDPCNNIKQTDLDKLYPVNKQNHLELMAGPIVFDKNGPPYYYPTGECKCIEAENRLCTSCDGTLSGDLCKK